VSLPLRGNPHLRPETRLVPLSPALRRVQRARAARERARDRLREVQREYEQAVRDAYDAGESLSAIGRVLGVTRQRVKQIVGGNCKLPPRLPAWPGGRQRGLHGRTGANRGFSSTIAVDRRLAGSWSSFSGR
jgi:hypothetical protein